MSDGCQNKDETPAKTIIPEGCEAVPFTSCKDCAFFKERPCCYSKYQCGYYRHGKSIMFERKPKKQPVTEEKLCVPVYHVHGLSNYMGTCKIHADAACRHLVNWKPPPLLSKTIVREWVESIAAIPISCRCKTCWPMNKDTNPKKITDAQSSVLWNIAVDSAIRSFNGEESEESFKKSILKFKSELQKLLNKKRK